MYNSNFIEEKSYRRRSSTRKDGCRHVQAGSRRLGNLEGTDSDRVCWAVEAFCCAVDIGRSDGTGSEQAGEALGYSNRLPDWGVCLKFAGLLHFWRAVLKGRLLTDNSVLKLYSEDTHASAVSIELCFRHTPFYADHWKESLKLL